MKRPQEERRDDHEQRRQPAESEQHQPEERRRDPPRPAAFPLLEELAEDGDERRRERRVRDERAHEVRQLERDREVVDRAACAEVVRGDDLADETEDAGERSREREDRRRQGEPTARVPLLHAAEYREAGGRFLVDESGVIFLGTVTVL